ncbi:MAG: hypothetical protein HQ581_03265 [Planctomycetes bacterium]|nr:hypothetical protein [Planctomycetota bacterium]
MKTTDRTGKRTRRRRGVLTFEWILLISLLVIGIIGGLSAVRDALNCELIDLAECIESIEVCCDEPGCDPSGCPENDPNCCDNAPDVCNPCGL